MQPDIYKIGILKGWKITDASKLTNNVHFECDLVVIGTGAGGSMAAELAAKAGLKVIMVEEGPLKSSPDFTMMESDAYPQLYQESASRKTSDKGINIFQGRCVGGSTTVNWTTCFRAPEETLNHWVSQYGLSEMTSQSMAPWFQMAEKRLNVEEWPLEPNQNNDCLRRGAEKLGISFGTIHRNVKNCEDLGYCGMGCPIDAKQSTLVTSIPEALQNGATLIHSALAEKLIFSGDKARSLVCAGMIQNGIKAGPIKITIQADHFILAAGTPGSPAFLLRSKVPDPYNLLGKRVFLHPVAASTSVMPELVEAFSGAPQVIYSDHFIAGFPLDGKIGFKLEVPPLHPVMAATVLSGFGKKHQQMTKRFAYTSAIIALMRDGFHLQSPGGSISLKKDQSPLIDYPITDYVWDGIRRSYLAMAEIQFAAGAQKVQPIHEDCQIVTSWKTAKDVISNLPMEILRAKVVCAHQMGGCAMGTSPHNSVVNQNGQHHQINNLFVADASLFPTGLGTNPQMTIYALSLKILSGLIESLGKKPITNS